MSLFAGIDYDSDGVYVALVDEDTGRLAAWRELDLTGGLSTTRAGDSFQRARRVRDLMPARSSWADAGVVAIGVEATFSQAFKATAALARVQGALVACLPRDLPVRALPANQRAPRGWKALTVGRTNATKEDVAAWALGNGAPAGLVQDIYDAFAIARAIRELLAARSAA